MSSLSAAQIEAFRADGYLVLEDFASPEACAAIRERSQAIVADFDPDADGGVSIFTTNDQTRHSDEYFLTSGDQIRCFFEEEAFDGDGNPTRPTERSINKIGHAMHDLDPAFVDFSHTAEIASICADVGFVDPLLLQSMVIFKQPQIGGEVDEHTDHTFLWTEPASCVGLWFALEPATVDNGCLWVLPGGHELPVRKRFRRDGSGGTTIEVMDPEPYPREGWVPVEAEVGTLVLLHGALPHRSEPNRSDRSRMAYTLHVIDGTADYVADNWLQRPDLPLRGPQPVPQGPPG